MKRTKAAWLTRGSAIALMVAGGIALSACSGGDDGLSMAEEEALQEQLEEERKKAEEARKAAEEAERKRQAEEEARKEAERKAADDAAKAAAAEQQRQQEEERRQAAEQERQRLAEEAAKARKVAEQAGAKAAFTALGADDGARADPGDVTDVTPRFGRTATVTTSPAVDFENERRSSSGRWSVTTLSNDGITYKDDLVVYSDLGGPTPVLFTEHSTYMSLFSAVTDTNNIRATLTGNTHPIASSRFPGGGRSTTFEHTIDSDPVDDADGDGNSRNDYDTTRFAGTFAGVSGTFECTGGACTVAHEGGSIYNLSTGTWTFTTGKTARAPVPDDSYMYFGWWERERKSDGMLSFEMFSDGAHEVDDIPDPLTGTATYSGPAVGQYAIYQPLGTQTAAGSFTARAELTANFGAATAEGTLSGRVTNFSNASDWSVMLKSTAIDGGGVADGAVSWTIGGNTEEGGMWDAQFFSDVDGSTAYPQGVAGTFDAKFSNVGRMIGAFGAHCPTSTCPRN